VFQGFTHYFENGQYKEGPAYPSDLNPGVFQSPCLASIDNDSALIAFGNYWSIPDNAFVPYNQVRTYNFTSGLWTRMRDANFSRKNANCAKVTLSDGKAAILLIGKDKSFCIANHCSKISFFFYKIRAPSKVFKRFFVNAKLSLFL